jgi:hypothetical protein
MSNFHKVFYNALKHIDDSNINDDSINSLIEVISALEVAYSASDYLLREPDLNNRSRIKYLDYKSVISLVKNIQPYISQIADFYKINNGLKLIKIEDDFNIFNKNKIEDDFSESLNIIADNLNSIINNPSVKIECKYSILQNYYDSVVSNKSKYMCNDFILIAKELNQDKTRTRKKEYIDKTYSFNSEYYVKMDHGFYLYLKSLIKNIYCESVFYNLKKNN